MLPVPLLGVLALDEPKPPAGEPKPPGALEPNPLPVPPPPPNKLPPVPVADEPNAGLFWPKSPPPELPPPNGVEVVLDVAPKPPKLVPDVELPPKRLPPVEPKGFEPKLVVVLLPKPPRGVKVSHRI